MGHTYVKSFQKLNQDEWLIKVGFEPNPLAWFFGAKPEFVIYSGSASVWNEYPDGNAASTSMEMWLSERVKELTGISERFAQKEKERAEGTRRRYRYRRVGSTCPRCRDAANCGRAPSSEDGGVQLT